jgi:very-short-patch-repair endonuclease
MPPSTQQQRLVSMLDYLEQWDKLNRTPTFDVVAHQGLVIWQNDLKDLPGFHLESADATGEVWMEVERLRPAKPPVPAAALVPWLIIPDDPTKEPRSRETLPNPEDPEKPLRFDESATLQSHFAAYLSGPWSKWSAAEAPRRKSISIYDKLFNLLQTIETEGAETALELVWGIGVTLWQTDKHRVRYPLLSQLVEIDPIGTDMALRIRPREVPLLLEADIYVALENPGLPAFERAARTILDHPDSHITPFDEASFEQVLTGAAGTLDRRARYWPRESDYEPGKLPSASDSLTVTNTWVVFARRKGTNFLIEDVRRLRAKVETEPVPSGAPTVLVEDPEGEAPTRVTRGWRGLSSAGFQGGWSSSGTTSVGQNPLPSGELYFPKPFNAEQVQIIDRLENAAGVVVQGPPGTGKTHTIANVICHYLAEGKRVLVTSKGESALAVLRDQLPAPIQHLTVSLLTSERDGLKQLEQSVSKITTEITSLNPGEVQKEIGRCRSRIDQLHQRITDIDRELGDWAKKNIDSAPASLGGLKPAEMARCVVEMAATYQWFPDALDSRPAHEPSFSHDDINGLREARVRAGADLIYLATPLPDAASIPTASEASELHRSLIEMETITETLDEQTIPKLKAPSRDVLSDPAKLRQLLENAERVAKLLRDAARIRRTLSDKWVDWLRSNFEARQQAKPVFAVVLQKRSEIQALIETRRQFIGVAIEWEDDWDADDELFSAVQNAAAGRSPFGLLPFGKKTARERFQRVRLNGLLPKELTDWKWIETHIVVRRQIRVVAYGWNTLAAECPSPLLPTQPAEALRKSEDLIDQMTQAERWVTELAPNLANEVQIVFADVRSDGVVDDPERMESLADAIDLRVRRKRLEDARHHADALLAMFRKSSLPCFQCAASFVSEKLGNTVYDSIAIEKEWQDIAGEFERLRALHPDFETIWAVSQLIESNGAPIWAKQLREMPEVADQVSVLPDDWAAAWKWRRQFGHLLQIDGRVRMQELAKGRVTLQNDLSNAYTELVERLTWLKLKETLDKDRGLMSALQQYMAAIRGIGAGTGIRAVRYRQDARKAMARANQAIRCWIMPHWRVSESLPSELALFDLVIVDEASQSDLWALPAMLRAKKLLVVGDNKQVSPSAVGVKEADIRQLHARFLRNLPFGDVLSPEKSVYDLASVMFASDLIRLREHFRCVEPIIEFSNRLCYNGEVRCLRVPKASERITPPLVDVFVRGGAREGRGKVNRIEAQAIVDEIKVITDTPRLQGRTIGVVSLLGGDQAKHIFELLITQLGEEKIIAHKIRCGDAMTFQGREADIVFISMVSDGDSVRALSGEMYEQRFNVAVSRAKDRLYLFRSFRREDLKEHDLRAQLVNHFQNPLRRDTEKKGRDRCESDFEREVYDRLNAAGYRVLPQVAAGGYRIDLVVEGAGGRRLAVECDGDQYHGPDVWMEDLQRQRTLERAGWTFWRCWGSSFLRDPDSCMADLFAVLKSHGIEAIGGLDADLSDVVEYREVGVQESAEPDTSQPSDETTDDEEPSIPVQVTADEASHHIKVVELPDQKPATKMQVTQLDLLPAEGELPLWKAELPNPALIEIGDSVRYSFTDEPDDIAFVTLVVEPSNPNIGTINIDTAIGRVLRGLSKGDERAVELPMGKRTLKVIEILKPSRK